MPSIRRVLSILPAAAAGLVIVQILRTVRRADLPSFANQDPSATFGRSDLPPLRIVALGDSSITAPGVENLDNTWIRRIAIAFSGIHRVELISVAVGGAKARDVIEGQLAEAARLAPDVAIVSVGANDAIRTPSPERYRRDLRRILSELDQAGRAIVVLGIGDLGSIPRLSSMLRPILIRRAARFNGIAASVAAEFGRAVKVPTTGPISTAFRQDPGLFAGDQFHIGDEGHSIFAQQALPAVRAALVIARGTAKSPE